MFGVTCSPYLLGAVLHYHLNKAKEEAVVPQQLLKSCYVDNLVMSVNSVDDARSFQKTAVSLLLPAQFDLRAWEFGPVDDEKLLPVLGYLWNRKKDTIMLDVRKIEEPKDNLYTLRILLSIVHSIFDPLGFSSPFVILGKLLLRRCHEEKSGMDTTLPQALTEDIKRWAVQIPVLGDLEVPRHVHYGKNAKYSLHVLCDASSVATAAAVFLRKENSDGVVVLMLRGVSQVAPKKKNPITIPLLETVACVIGSRLIHSVLEDLGNPPISVTMWSDSMACFCPELCG